MSTASWIEITLLVLSLGVSDEPDPVGLAG